MSCLKFHLYLKMKSISSLQTQKICVPWFCVLKHTFRNQLGFNVLLIGAKKTRPYHYNNESSHISHTHESKKIVILTA